MKPRFHSPRWCIVRAWRSSQHARTMFKVEPIIGEPSSRNDTGKHKKNHKRKKIVIQAFIQNRGYQLGLLERRVYLSHVHKT